MNQSSRSAKPNRLIHETSPYLLQHAHNPVDWHPWGEEAFERARRESKPVFLSIGYAACHWCHVMERESFESEQIAAILNENFVSIKVDREQRPDLDSIFMLAVQMLTGSGGWPMTVFLTPEGKPFFGGTYFPPEDRYGHVGLRRVLLNIARLWREQPSQIAEGGARLAEAIEQVGAAEPEMGDLAREPVEQAVAILRSQYDPAHGGFGPAPKFPPSMALRLLLREHKRTGEAALLEMVERTLRKMTLGGLFDQLGGGFHRYSVDSMWLVPHFEKMLYDNALLATVYFEAALTTGNRFYERVACRTLDYVLRDLADPAGGFYSSQDADSEGVEGKYYTWRPEEVSPVLGGAGSALFCEFYDVSAQGNWPEAGEGSNILNVRIPLDDFAQMHGEDADLLERRLEAMRLKMLAERSGRVAPATDDKVLTAWNGLMISALARGARSTGQARYLEAATRAARFLLEHLRRSDGVLLRCWRGGVAQVPGFLEDYAHLTASLVDLYEASLDSQWLAPAESLAVQMIDRFSDPSGGGFFMADGSDPLVTTRLKDIHDGVTPSGSASAAGALLRLGILLGREDFTALARQTLRSLTGSMGRHPAAHLDLLGTLAFALAPPQEVSIAGAPGSEPVQAFFDALNRRYLPDAVFAWADPERSAEVGPSALCSGRSSADGRPAAYVCRDCVCGPPAWDATQMLAQLGEI